MRGIAVCGLGKLGSNIAAVFAASAVPTVGYDLDISKVYKINQHIAPVDEPQLAEYLGLPEVQTNLIATDDIQDVVGLSDACMFVTPTPSLPSGAFDHEKLLAAIGAIAREVRRQRKRKYLFVVNSTVVPRFMDDQATPLLDRLMEDTPYRLAYKPEFIALGTVITNLHYPDILLIGADCEETADAVEGIYRLMILQNSPAKKMTLVDAELAKISLNCAVTMKISFANQVGLVARKIGADPSRVLDAVGGDHRIGHACMKPGLPWGGPCFPRDGRMFQYVAGTVGESAPLAHATDCVNRRVLREILECVPEHGDVGILGLAYKAGTPITEESAGFSLRQVLLSRGRRVKCHDVAAKHLHSMEEVLSCPTVIVACAWPEYRSLTVHNGTVVIDPMGAVEEIVRTLPIEVK